MPEPHPRRLDIALKAAAMAQFLTTVLVLPVPKILKKNTRMSMFRYLSPNSLSTMIQMENTILPVSLSADQIACVLDRALADVGTVSDSNQRTRNQFRPRAGKGGAASYQLRQYAEVTLGGGSLRKVVKLPEGEDENEWLAVNSKEVLVEEMGTVLTVGYSGRLLQPDQPSLWSHHRVLLAPVLPRDEGYR